MTRGSKANYSAKQKRKAQHIEAYYEQQGLSAREAVKRAWATVNKQTGGAAKSTSNAKRGRGRPKGSKNKVK